MKIRQLHQLYTQNYLVDTDTRTIRKGSLFFALKGDNFDGNKFAEEALKKGAKYAIIDNPKFYKGTNTILVKDTLRTLQKLANYHRKDLDISILSLTGSNGKTTTKELINVVLSKKFKTSATKGNLNNHIGVPLTLLSMTLETEIGIVEMGANHLNEITFLCTIAEPNYGYITNFGKAHLEGFGSTEGVIKGKSELYDYLKKTNGIAFVNTDDAIQVKQASKLKTITFNATVIEYVEANPFVTVKYENTLIRSKLIGKYNYYNIASSVAIGKYFGVPVNDIKNAIENYTPTNNRSQIIEKGNFKIILDAYNANPSSMQAALENFNQLKAPAKIVFLGDMFELGNESIAAHQKIAELANSFSFSEVHLIGESFAKVSAKNTFVYKSFEDFKKQYKPLYTASTILIKGSRGMALERILDLL